MVRVSRRNNCRLLDVGHVYNVRGTMESCPTYFCLNPQCTHHARIFVARVSDASLPATE